MDSLSETQKQIDDFCKAISEVVKKVIQAIRPLIDWFKKLAIRISNYPNKKVVHLALYAKKKRIRRKNRNRMFSDIVKGW